MAIPVAQVTAGSRRCRTVRVPRSGCRDCAEACPVAAVAVGASGPVIDEGLCDRCGACVAACPPGALSDGLDERLLAAGIPSHGAEMVVQCRHAAPAPDATVTLPCLLRVSPELLVFVSAGAQRPVRLSRGDCEQRCERQPVSCDGAVAQAHALASAVGLTLHVTLSDVYTTGVSRRGFFGGLLRRAGHPVADPFPASTDLPAIGEPTARRNMLLAGLSAALVAPKLGSSPLLGRVDVLPGRICDGCEACGRACPTGAIRVQRDGGVRIVEHTAAYCDGCGACEAACGPRVLRVGGAVDLDDLDPRSIRILALAEPERCGICGGPLPANRDDGLCPSCSRRAAMGVRIGWTRPISPPPDPTKER